MKLREYLNNNIIYLDGGMGTMLQKSGLALGELPERLNISAPELITDIHSSYFAAGSQIICTNTFGANSLKFSPDELELIISKAVENAKRARDRFGSENRFIALDIGPCGRMLAPYGDLDFEEAVSVFSSTVKLGAKYGVDLVFIETMNDSYETKAALLAAKESCSLPVFVSNAYGSDGKLMTGADAAAMVAMLEGLGADAIGVNCSLGPRALADVIAEYSKYSSLPIILKPNAGLPKSVDGKTVYDLDASCFADEVADIVIKNPQVRAIGGCCGTTPEYIEALVKKTECNGLCNIADFKKDISLVSSYTHAVEFGSRPILIGERINPTGKKRFKEALRQNDIDYILSEGLAQQERGVDILDVNVGLPEIDEPQMLTRAVCELQAIIDLPLQIDTSDTVAMEKALRRYNGKPMINSVNGKRESMEEVFPLAKKYGGVIVALTLDESGIPETAEGRFEIAKNILSVANSYGIDKKDIIFDPLALTVSADNTAGMQTLNAVKMITDKLGAHTSLGVSNVSFGLPMRNIINSVFFALALQNGLSAAIINPYSTDMMQTFFAFNALHGLDDNCEKYIEFASTLQTVETTVTTPQATSSQEYSSELQAAISKGRKEQAAILTAEMLKNRAPLDIVQEEIIPALDIVGRGFEKNTVYLPQLLMSAEAAKFAFEKIKASVPTESSASKGIFILATVKGDIHDIGKNIVKLLLQNYGFGVIDLGRDVEPETIADEVVKTHAPIVGLSALMTTTVPSMEKTIALLRERAPWCKVIVGGAVLTQEYADAIGADKYAKDAMEAVRYAEKIISQ